MGPILLQEGTGTSPSGVRKKGITGLITHHKVAVTALQPRCLCDLKRLTDAEPDMAEFAGVC
jgi:hypothetical protein